MKSSESLLRDFSQNTSLPIRLIAPGFGHVPPEAAAHYGVTHRLAYYFLFLWEGTTKFGIDLEKHVVAPQELVFSLPHQIRQLPASSPSTAHYKLGLQQECLTRLPRYYPFLLNPLNQQKSGLPPRQRRGSERFSSC